MDGEILDGAWYVHLRRARCEEDVVAAVREFLATLTAQEVACLRRRLEISHGDEIGHLSSTLASAYEALAPDASERITYIRTIALLCYATDRLSQLPRSSRVEAQAPS
jgi:hypothetical protein